MLAYAQSEWGTYVLANPGFRQELEELELAEGAQAEHGVVEGRDLLDGDLAAGGPVDGGTDDAVRALADDIEHLILCACSRTQCEKRLAMVGGRSDVEREEGRTNIEADFSWCGLGLGGSVRVLALGRSWLGGGSLFGHSGGAGGGEGGGG